MKKYNIFYCFPDLNFWCIIVIAYEQMSRIPTWSTNLIFVYCLILLRFAILSSFHNFYERQQQLTMNYENKQSINQFTLCVVYTEAKYINKYSIDTYNYTKTNVLSKQILVVAQEWLLKVIETSCRTYVVFKNPVERVLELFNYCLEGKIIIQAAMKREAFCISFLIGNNILNWDLQGKA